MRSMSKQRNKIIFAIVISMMISACGVKEDVQKERGTDEGLIEETESQIPADAKKYLEYLFDYLHPDRSDMVDLGLYKLRDKLYYKWKFIDEAGQLSDTNVLAYMLVSEDGKQYGYTAYSQVPSMLSR